MNRTAVFRAPSGDVSLIKADAVIVDVDATAPTRKAEVEITKEMIVRTRDRFGLYPAKLVADTANGSAPLLNWLVEEEGIEPYIPVIRCLAGDAQHR